MVNPKYRRIVPNDNSKKQPYKIIILWLLFISPFLIINLLMIYISWDYGNSLRSYFFYSAFVFLLIIIILIIIECSFWRNREVVSTIKIPEMNSKAKRASKKIYKLFSDVKIIDVLKFSNITKYGNEMPLIYVFISDDLSSGYVAIENIANFSRLDKSKIEQSVSGILSGKYKRFSVVSSALNINDSYMMFYFEDTETSHRIIIKKNNIEDYLSDNAHFVILSKDLTWKSNIVPHLSIIARTRSGKSMLAGSYMAPLMKKQGWVVEYNSAKYDKYVKKFNGKSEINEIVGRAEYWCSVMKDRLSIINRNDNDKYTEVDGMKDIAIFFDELGNLNAGLDLDKSLKKRWETSINKLSATGASAGIHIIAISQFATKDGFLPSLARVNCSDAVIMLGGAADSGDERRYLMPGFSDLPARNYGVGQGIAMILASGRKWSTPHFYETPLFHDY